MRTSPANDKNRRRAAPLRGSSCPPRLLCLHPAASLIPAMSAGEYAALLADIHERGIIALLDVTPAGVILDGRHRHRAAVELGLARVPIRVVSPADEVAYMVRAAVHRRHLSQSQVAAITVAYHHHQPKTARGRRRDQLALQAGVSPRLVGYATAVYQNDPDLFAQILNGEISADRAASRIRRHLRDAALVSPPLPPRRFDVILADPPWPSANPDAPSSPEQHYPTITIQEICALQVPAADDAILYCWIVSHLLPEALEVISAWGFTYKTHGTWAKPSIGTGVWLRNQHETYLVATRGAYSPAESDLRHTSLIQAPRRAHSQKPDQLYEQIERAYPHAKRRLELYARTTRPGWTAWGNQAPTEEADAA